MEEYRSDKQPISREVGPNPEIKPDQTGLDSSGRLISLDILRGITIALMLLVNNVALDTSTPRQLTHAEWNAGVRVADLVFPWFLYCVGVAVPFSWASFHRKGGSVWRYDLKAFGRAMTLVLLGCLIDSSIAKTPVFALGVLQLIGLAYFVGAVFYELPALRRVILAALMLVGYWAAIKFLPVPGVGVGVFEESRNLISHINRTYLAPYHLAGLLSVIPTSALVLIGTAIGDALRRDDRSSKWKAGMLAVSGAVMTGLGILWNLSLAFNKPLWTPSYILFCAGTATLLFCLLYVIVDIKGWKWWAYPLIVFGSNAIFAYVAPILVKLHIFREWSIRLDNVGVVSLHDWYLRLLSSHYGRFSGGWLYTASYIVLWWVILWWLYRKRIFLKV